MDRMACVDLPELPLQMVLRECPSWRCLPVVVVDRDKPSGLILWANDRARRCRIVPGMRYAAGLSLVNNLCVQVVPASAIADEVKRLIRLLEYYSPCIEPATEEPGIFWLAANGLDRLHGSFANWAAALGRALREAGLYARMAVGFTRFGCYAATKMGRDVLIFRDVTQERTQLRSVPIACLGLDPATLETLGRLGIAVAGDFLDLPEAAVLRRFGPAISRLHRLARDKEWAPINDHPSVEPVEASRVLDYPEASFERLQAVMQPMVRVILSRFHERREAVSGLRVTLGLDDRSRRDEHIVPAEPTLSERQLIGLLRLRIETLSFSAGVVELKLRGDGVPATPRQLELFQQPPGRDPAAALEAFARIRAELGNDAIVRARLCEGHLPEARFEWQPFEKIASPKPVASKSRPLVRRLHTPPVALPVRSGEEPDGWLVTGPGDGPVEEIIGPHLLEGGWWRRGIARAYHYLRTRSGRWLWVYRDRKRQRWFLHGEVE